MIAEARHGRILVLTMARAARRNAIDRAMAEALLAAFDRAAAGDAAAIVLAAEGPAFCAGADLGELRALSADAAARAARAALTTALLAAPGSLPMPVVAAVGGPAMGAGASLALACDAVVMGEAARLCWPEAAHGMVPRLVAPVLLRHLGPKPAFDLLASGRAVPAAEALALGLATLAVPQDRLMPEAIATAEAMARLPRDGMAALKALLREGAR